MTLSKNTRQLVYFGDSLSDRGNFDALASAVLKVALPPATEGYVGRFSDGEVQSGYTPDLLGLDVANYAVGAARAIGSRTVQEYIDSFGDPDILLSPPRQPDVLATDTYLGGQVERFLADVGPEGADPGTAAVFFIGVNDYNNLDPSNPPTPDEAVRFVGQVIGSVVAGASAVAAAGVDQVLLYTLPDPEFFPIELIYPPEIIALGGQLVDAHNAALKNVAGLLAAQGVDAQIVDINRVAAEIVEDARTFGLLPELLNEPKLLGIGSRPMWDGASDSWEIPDNAAVADVDPAQLPFFDLLHPSTATHGVLGAFAAESLASQVRLLGRGDDFVFDASRDDLMLSGAGDDTIRAGAGEDVVLAGLGDDRAAGGAGSDILAGGLGNDRLAGGEGCDVLAGSDGDDLQRGGDGGDALIDGLGRDRLRGGGGRDAFLYVEAVSLGGGNALDGGDFRGGAGVDTLYMALSDATRGAVEGALTAGASAQSIAAIDVTTASIERYVFLDPTDGVDGIVTGARIAEADIWGFV